MATGGENPATEADIRDELRRICRTSSQEIDLGRAALLLAALEKPGSDIQPYLRHLKKLSREIGNYVFAGGGEADLATVLEALDQVFVRRYGYDGSNDVFDDPDGANMMAVIDNRTGLPVILGTILIHAGRALGWNIAGVNFPARFLVRLDVGGKRTILDPFDRLRRLGPKDLRRMHKSFSGKAAELLPLHYQDASDADVLLRVLNNTKLRHMRRGRFSDALDVLDIMLLIDPRAPGVWREAGLINARLDNIPAAIGALEAYLRYETKDVQLYRTSVLIQELRDRLNR